MTTIKLCTSTGDREVEAQVVGVWAVHPAWESSGWAVSHVHTGRLVHQFFDESKAVQVANALHEQLGAIEYPDVPRGHNNFTITREMRRVAKRISAVVQQCLALGDRHG